MITQQTRRAVKSSGTVSELESGTMTKHTGVMEG